MCYGLWTAQPEDCSYASDPTAIPDWSVFGSFTQTRCGNKFPVPLYLYQYMEPGSALNICGVKGFAGGQNLDLDSSDNRGGQSYMLSRMSLIVVGCGGPARLFHHRVSSTAHKHCLTIERPGDGHPGGQKKSR